MLKTHPRNWSIHKLLDAVAHGGNPQDRAASLFTTLTSSLFGQALPYSETKKVSNFDARIFYLFALFRTEPYISSFQGTHSTQLGFRSIGRYKYYTMIESCCTNL